MTLVTAAYSPSSSCATAGAVITLIFVAILSHQLAASAAEGPRVAKAMLLANLIGGFMAWVAHELIVINPTFTFMALTVLLLCFTLWNRLISGNPSAPLAATALTSALIILGGAMAPLGKDIDLKIFDRLFQLASALAWVLLSFVTIDEILPERRAAPQSAQ
ncbi:hypothetical protein CLV78_1011036 [Aliiruegeria haliotis]|uniref:Uncharacterized protein n=1 Tax=Aliiruegeria haliotis TaxID=1280846 RepID=A0A2T0S0H1_9RHOB|nr:hypothetical protein [Aliiruegeria haliotis]PRY26931.1 hypothetical protein CLV78_1011036 [Aliiruegeria haliotis]